MKRTLSLLMVIALFMLNAVSVRANDDTSIPNLGINIDVGTDAEDEVGIEKPSSDEMDSLSTETKKTIESKSSSEEKILESEEEQGKDQGNDQGNDQGKDQSIEQNKEQDKDQEEENDQKSALEIERQPENAFANVGDTAVFSVSANSDARYLWMRSKDNGATWEKAFYEGYTTNEMKVPVKEWVYRYLFYCKIADSNGNEVETDVVRVKHYGVEITSQPADAAAAVGETAVFNIEANGTGVKYMWMRSKDNGATWEKAFYEGYTTNEMKVPVKDWVYNYQFYCMVSDSEGNEVSSVIVKVTHGAVVLTQAPTDVVARIDETACFSVKAEGFNVKYLWMRSKDNGVTWEKAFYEGYTTSEMKVPVKDWVYRYQFYCLITDGSGNQIQTDIVRVKHTPVEITLQPTDAFAPVGGTAKFKTQAEGTGVKYLWMRSKDNGKTWEKAFYEGYTTNEMKIPVKEWVYRYQFYCQISDADGNTVNTDIVYVKEKDENLKVLLTADEHEYSDSTSGDMLLSRKAFAEGAVIDEYSVKYENAGIDSNGLYILRFVAYSEKECGHVNVTLNDKEYNGKFTLPSEKTEFYIPIKGIQSISDIDITFIDVDCKVNLSDVELINYGSTNVTTLHTGLYNIAGSEKVVLTEDESLGAISYCVETDENYLYSLNNGYLEIFDKADMHLVSQTRGLGAVRDIELYGNYIIISSRENGIFFLDISNKQRPQIISHYDTLELATGIDVYDHYVFACSRMFGLEIIDIEDIYNPKFVSSVMRANEEYYDCCVSDGYLYVAVWAHKRVEIYSLDDIANPAYIKTILVDGECAGISVQNGILYVATGYHGQGNVKDNCAPGYGMGNGMEIYDVSNARQPVWLSSSKIDGRYRNAAFDHWRLRVSGNYAYFTNIFNGVYVYDISDPKAPKRVNHITIYIDKSSKNYHRINQGSFLLPYDTLAHGQGLVTGIAVDDGVLYIGDSYTGIYKYEADYIVRETDNDGDLSDGVRNAPSLNDSGLESTLYYGDHSIYAVDRSDDYVYVAGGDDGVLILDNNLEKINTIKTEGAVRDVKRVGDYLYVAENEKGLGVYEISGDTLTPVKHLSTNYYNACFSHIEVNADETILLVQAGWARLAVFGIEDKAAPVLIDSTYTSNNMYFKNLASGVATDNRFAYSDTSNTFVYKISETGEKQLVGSYPTGMGDRDGAANYDGKLIMVSDNGYFVVDKETGERSSKITIPGMYLRGKVAAKDGIMVVCNQYTSHVYIVDISDINSPRLLKDIQVDGNPELPYISDGEVFVPCRNGGLVKIKLQ